MGGAERRGATREREVEGIVIDRKKEIKKIEREIEIERERKRGREK